MRWLLCRLFPILMHYWGSCIISIFSFIFVKIIFIYLFVCAYFSFSYELKSVLILILGIHSCGIFLLFNVNYVIQIKFMSLIYYMFIIVNNIHIVLYFCMDHIQYSPCRTKRTDGQCIYIFSAWSSRRNIGGARPVLQNM